MVRAWVLIMNCRPQIFFLVQEFMLQLDRKLSNKRIFPAIDLPASSTRRDDLLLGKDVLSKMVVLRNHLGDMNSEEAINLLIQNMRGTKSNEEFIVSMNG